VQRAGRARFESRHDWHANPVFAVPTPIRAGVRLDCDPLEAFDRFTAALRDSWPGDELEPFAGGRVAKERPSAQVEIGEFEVWQPGTVWRPSGGSRSGLLEASRSSLRPSSPTAWGLASRSSTTASNCSAGRPQRL
jgi:hypothetical protein